MSPARVVRGAAICTVGVLPAVAAHVAAGGPAALDPLLVVTVLALTAAMVVASRREWTTPALVGALALTQIGVHCALWVSGTHAPHHTAVTAANGVSPPSGVHDGLPMFAWHAIAVAASTVLLRHGERLVHLFGRLVRCALGERADLAPPSGPRPLRPATPATGLLRPRTLLLGVADRRGPPLLLPAS